MDTREEYEKIIKAFEDIGKAIGKGIAKAIEVVRKLAIQIKEILSKQNRNNWRKMHHLPQKRYRSLVKAKRGDG